MVAEPHTQLTNRDHGILQDMLERYKGPHGVYSQLLERKIRLSSICFREDIPPGVVTLGARLTYRVNGVLNGPHKITRENGSDDGTPFLSILTTRGLALIGLAERTRTIVQLENGSEELIVEDVLSQPEAEEKARENLRGIGQTDSSGRTSNVVSFQLKRAPLPSAALPEDDDPGPSAA